MLETLKQLDTEWFITINNHWQNGLLDIYCPFLRKQGNWYFLYVLLAYFMFREHGKKAWWLLLAAAVTVLVADQLSATLIKKTVERLRPCNDPLLKDRVRLLVHCGSGYSFVSSHASDHFAIGMFFWGVFREGRKWVLPACVLWAAAVGFSQIYVGVHYPLDVLCGSLLGTVIGLISVKLTHKYILRFKSADTSQISNIPNHTS